ncbi:MAG: BRCT domain-containing protein, partial [bacterium]|nr:BRCT domain-containing protein [bacterium]
ASFDDVSAVEGVGDIVARSITEYFADPKTDALLKKFRSLGVTLARPRSVGKSPFSGKTVVVTGSVPGMSREEAWDAVRRLGGKVSESVGNRTHLLVVGAEAGSKLRKAQALKIPTMDAEAFAALVKKHREHLR